MSGMNYYQPKETSDKVYAGLPRFTKGETVKYSARTNNVAASAFFGATCATKTAALLGASNLIAGAAVAFGAATLAF